jgi:4-amino-4-deoxy-L-arabinose transferase-like glycosyltransferase
MSVYPRHAVIVILIGIAVRTALAAWLPLSVDGNYAIAVAREFSISFLDHPPLGFWLPGWSAGLLGVESPLSFRLPFLLMGALTGWCLYLIGNELAGPAAGFWTVLLYTLSPFFTLFAGTFVLPDGPLDLFLALAALLLLRCFRATESGLWRWIAAGGAMALALASKYQAIFLLLSMLVFAVAEPRARRLLSRPGPYVAGLIALAGLGPVMVWNIQNEWASFAFHADRIGQGIQAVGFLVSLAGQAIYLLPWTFVAAIAGMSSVWRGGLDRRWLLIAPAAIGPVVALNLGALDDSDTPEGQTGRVALGCFRHAALAPDRRGFDSRADRLADGKPRTDSGVGQHERDFRLVGARTGAGGAEPR